MVVEDDGCEEEDYDHECEDDEDECDESDDEDDEDCDNQSSAESYTEEPEDLQKILN